MEVKLQCIRIKNNNKNNNNNNKKTQFSYLDMENFKNF